MTTPVIGIPCRLIDDPEYGIQAHGISASYIESVLQAEGRPVLLPLFQGRTNLVHDYAAMCDAFLFAGGEDLDPTRYGKPRHPSVQQTCASRDGLELELFKVVLQSRKPILGICRGLQLINVALGGTLVQDIPTERSSDVVHGSKDEEWEKIVHTVMVDEGTHLSAIVGAGSRPVNSLHHQCIDDLGKGLIVAALSPTDGIIEAVELPREDQWLVAVQWHPEVLWKETAQGGLGLGWNLELFRALIEAAQVGG
jgi:putative glutamine amidotransferase